MRCLVAVVGVTIGLAMLLTVAWILSYVLAGFVATLAYMFS